MKDKAEQILAQWDRPEASADLADRIIAAAGTEARTTRPKVLPFVRLALAASLVLALGLGYTLQGNAPAPVAVNTPHGASIDGMDILADVDLSDGDDEFAMFDDGIESSIE